VLGREQRDWDNLAVLDPLWAILSDRRHKFGRWGTTEFLAEGDREVERLVTRARSLGVPREWKSALDFGCGVGRLAPGLSSYFDTYCGVDLSTEMVNQARELHCRLQNCRFVVNDDAANLSQFPDQSFDLIFSLYVLQHLTSRSMTLSYLQSFVRMLRPGGLLVFQLPHHIPRAEKLFYDGRRNLFLLFGRLGVRRQFMFRRLGLFPMTMSFVPEHIVVTTLEAKQATPLRIDSGRMDVAIHDRMYYVTREI
jgi:SAM-dependent methyltransferase